MMARVSVAISVHNEERVLRQCLESVRWADEVVVVDSGSTDRTAEIAGEVADRVITVSNHMMLNINKNVAIDNASNEWVLLLDGDEQVSSELEAEIKNALARVGDEVAGFWVPRLTYALGRPVKAFGWYPDFQLRLFRKSQARFPCLDHHEMVSIAQGQVDYLGGLLLHDSFAGIWDFVAKANLSSEQRALQLFADGSRFSLLRALTYPPYYFLRQYLFRGGIRYGTLGLFIASITAYSNWIQHAKLWALAETERTEPPGFTVPPEVPRAR
jgi:glycosyltransferase involved in cell wall biosynthesis